MAEGSRAVIWSPEARSDLSEIWDYYVKVAGRHTADRGVRGIGQACAMLDSRIRAVIDLLLYHPFDGYTSQRSDRPPHGAWSRDR
jgi:plasmid stabilization system protein ParE